MYFYDFCASNTFCKDTTESGAISDRTDQFDILQPKQYNRGHVRLFTVL